MHLREAVAFLRFGDLTGARPQKWADLGCGEGMFTLALASLLPNGSSIIAMDSDKSALSNLPDEFEQVTIEPRLGDFLEDSLPDDLDGVLMANSLHYVSTKPHFLTDVIEHMNPRHRFLIVEYETTIANHWIPYPVNYEKLETLFANLRYKDIKKLGQRQSVYGPQKMYAAMIRKRK